VKILLATDGSDCSEEADRFLTRFHFTAQDDIIILHAVSEIPYEDDYHAQIRLVIKRVAPKILDASVKILQPVKAKKSTQGRPRRSRKGPRSPTLSRKKTSKDTMLCLPAQTYKKCVNGLHRSGGRKQLQCLHSAGVFEFP